MATPNTRIFIFAGNARRRLLPTANFTRGGVSWLRPALTGRTFQGGEERTKDRSFGVGGDGAEVGVSEDYILSLSCLIFLSCQFLMNRGGCPSTAKPCARIPMPHPSSGH